MGDRLKAARRAKPNAGGTVQPRVRDPRPADGAGRPERSARRKVPRRNEREQSPALSGGAAESHGLYLPEGPPEGARPDLAVVPNAGRQPTYEELYRFHELHTKAAALATVAGPADVLTATVLPGPSPPVCTLANPDSLPGHFPFRPDLLVGRGRKHPLPLNLKKFVSRARSRQKFRNVLRCTTHTAPDRQACTRPPCAAPRACK